MGHCSPVVVMKFKDKLAGLWQLNSPNSQDKFQRCCIDMYLIIFLPNFAIFCMFLWISQLRNRAKYRKPCTVHAYHRELWQFVLRLAFHTWTNYSQLPITQTFWGNWKKVWVIRSSQKITRNKEMGWGRNASNMHTSLQGQ